MKSAFFLLFMFVFSSVALAQNIKLDIDGSCKEYNVTLTASDISAGCYDAKIDMTTPSGRIGRIFDPREGWKSSIYFVNEALCVNTTEANRTFQLVTESTYENVNFAAKLRFGSNTWQSSYYEIKQDCPGSPEGNLYLFFAVSAIVALVLLLLVILNSTTLKRRASPHS